jgi:hypothetical protein
MRGVGEKYEAGPSFPEGICPAKGGTTFLESILDKPSTAVLIKPKRFSNNRATGTANWERG